MASSLNPDLLISSILRRARSMPDAAVWLTERHTEALTAVIAGDEFVTSLSDEGGSNTAMRGMTATDLLQLYEVALQRHTAEETAGTTLSMPGGTDFSQGYSRV